MWIFFIVKNNKRRNKMSTSNYEDRLIDRLFLNEEGDLLRILVERYLYPINADKEVYVSRPCERRNNEQNKI